MIILLQPPAGRDSQFCAHRVNKCRQLVETHTPMKSTVGTDDRMERRETERGRQKKKRARRVRAERRRTWNSHALLGTVADGTGDDSRNRHLTAGGDLVVRGGLLYLFLFVFIYFFIS